MSIMLVIQGVIEFAFEVFDFGLGFSKLSLCGFESGGGVVKEPLWPVRFADEITFGATPKPLDQIAHGVSRTVG